jgi:hypothetical protein
MQRMEADLDYGEDEEAELRRLDLVVGDIDDERRRRTACRRRHRRRVRSFSDCFCHPRCRNLHNDVRSQYQYV